MIRVEERALKSLGLSESAIREKVAALLESRELRGQRVLDVGCGRGALHPHVASRFEEYVGIDVLRHEGFPEAALFRKVDLDTGRVDLPDACADLVIAIETIEHVENPRAFMRELVRLSKPGATLIVSTPNQLSLLSKLTLLLKNRFNAFQESDYPAHITALLEIDLLRMARENGLENAEIDYSGQGRVLFTRRHFPRALACAFPRALSDNIFLIAKR